MRDKNDSTEVDVVVIGGGIVALWSVYHILKKYPNLSVVVFEQEKFFGEHTTGRNSEVLHSGIYYPSNSMKHIHCLRGNEMWRDYIKQTKMPFLDCGKIIVATSGQEDALDALYGRAIENKVSGIRKLSKYEISQYQKNVDMTMGFFVPSAGVLDVPAGISQLKNDIERMGGIMLSQSKVELSSYSSGKFILEVNGQEITTTNLVNSGGLFAVNFRKTLGLHGYENYYVKGNYLVLKKSLDIDKLIYPIPPSDGLGLGVHLTLDIAGGQKFGPDTEITEELNYTVKKETLEKMYPSILKIFKNIEKNDLNLGYAGIRPKVKKDGLLVSDFVFNTEKLHGIKGYFEFLGIESPGLTSAPSLGLMLSELL